MLVYYFSILLCIVFRYLSTRTINNNPIHIFHNNNESNQLMAPGFAIVTRPLMAHPSFTRDTLRLSHSSYIHETLILTHPRRPRGNVQRPGTHFWGKYIRQDRNSLTLLHLRVVPGELRTHYDSSGGLLMAPTL